MENLADLFIFLILVFHHDATKNKTLSPVSSALTVETQGYSFILAFRWIQDHEKQVTDKKNIIAFCNLLCKPHLTA